MSEDPTGRAPYRRMTLTFGGIARANLVVVTVEGEHKAEALAAVAAGDDLPAARISAEQVVWLVDEAAASLL
jgi:6-phosphogluconolactonase/glucosamine-6-phosphate isomerase/deaminase